MKTFFLTQIVTYADDVAVVAKAPVTFKVGELSEEATDTIYDCLQGVGIELALDKTELIIPTRKRTRNTLKINNMRHRVQSKDSGKYLGINLDQRGTYKNHAAAVAEKADGATRSLGGIIPNLGGPRQHARKLLASVPNSILLYGAPVWCNIMSAGGWKIIMRGQRRIALRVAAAYRTVSGDAILVIANRLWRIGHSRHRTNRPHSSRANRNTRSKDEKRKFRGCHRGSQTKSTRGLAGALERVGEGCLDQALRTQRSRLGGEEVWKRNVPPHSGAVGPRVICSLSTHVQPVAVGRVLVL